MVTIAAVPTSIIAQEVTTTVSIVIVIPIIDNKVAHSSIWLIIQPGTTMDKITIFFIRSKFRLCSFIILNFFPSEVVPV